MPHKKPTLMISALLAVALASTSCSVFSLDVENPDSTIHRSLLSDGRSRGYQVYLPQDRDHEGLPLVIVYHGSGGTSEGIRLLSRFDSTAAQLGFVAAFPDATSDWAEGCDCSTADQNGIDDVAFTSDLIDAMALEFEIDTTRVFAAGFSQGGLMVYRLACELSDEISGVAAVGAPMSLPLSENCTNPDAIPLMVVLGTQDEVFPWEGAYDSGNQSTLSADSTAQFWSAANGCTGDRSSSLEFTGATSGIEVWREWYTGCPSSSEVVLYRLEGAGHIWPSGGFSASRTIGEFFMNQ